MKAINTSVVLSLLVTLAAGTALSVRADDDTLPPSKRPPPAAPPAPKKPVRQTLSGRIVAIDRYGRAITLQVGNLTYVLQITDSTRVSRNEKEQSFAEFALGQEINVDVLLRELPSGRIEVAVLSVELRGSATAQGKAKSRGDQGTFLTPPPFQNGPNPANIDGPVISRSR